jgi:hypothetical protein
MRAGTVSAAQPLHDRHVAAGHRLVGAEPELRHDDDGRRRFVGHGMIRCNGNAVAAAEGLALVRDDVHPEAGRELGLARERVPQVAGGRQHVDHAIERRAGGFGHGDDQHVEWRGPAGLHGVLDLWRIPTPSGGRASSGARPPFLS